MTKCMWTNMARKKRRGQFGGGKYSSMPQLAGNVVTRSRKKRNKKQRKSSHGTKRGKKNRSTQVPINTGFISKRLRNRPKLANKPITGIYNDMPSVQDRPSKMRPQQLAWGS